MSEELHGKLRGLQGASPFRSGSSRRFQNRLDKEWADIKAVFTAVIGLVVAAQFKAFQPLKERKRDVESAAKGLLDNLQAEINRLEKTISDLGHISGHEDHIFFLQVGGRPEHSRSRPPPIMKRF